MENFNNPDNEMYNERDIYLMAKYIVLADKFMDRYENKSFLSDIERKQIEKEIKETNDVVDEWNTSGKDNEELLEEHDFFKEDVYFQDALDTFTKMGGTYKYYPPNKYANEEYIYDKEKFDDAELYEAIYLEFDAFKKNKEIITSVMKDIEFDVDKSKEYVEEEDAKQKELSDIFTQIDEKMAKRIVKQYNGNSDSNYYTYIKLVNDYNKIDDLLNRMGGVYMIDETIDRYNTVETAATEAFYDKIKYKLNFTDKYLSVKWNEGKNYYSIKYDGTSEGLYTAIKEYNKKYKSKIDNEFPNILEHSVKEFCETRKLMPELLDAFETLSRDYYKLDGKLIAPKAENMMEFFADKNRIVTNKRTRCMGKYVFYVGIREIGHGVRRFGNYRKDYLYGRPLAAKRVLQAYDILRAKVKDIVVENGNGKEKTNEIMK